MLTGASGLLGANFLLAAADRYDIMAVAHRHPVRAGAELLAVDITDSRAVAEVVRRTRPAAIVHTAAMTGVDACEEDPAGARRLNTDATGYLATAAQAVGARFIAISTDYVFDGRKGRYTEEDPPQPLGVYAKTKLEGEVVARTCCPSATILRTTLYGWNAQPKHSFAERVLDGAAQRNPTTAFVDMWWSPILANDLAAAIVTVLEQPTPGVFHVAGRDRCSRYEFACAVATAFGHDPATAVRSGHLRDARLKAPRPPDASLDVSRFERTFGVTLPTTAQGIARMRVLQQEGWVTRLKALVPPD